MNNTSSKSKRRGKRGGRNNRPSLVAQLVRADRIANPSPPTYNSSHRYFKRIRFSIQETLSDYTIRSPDVANLLLVCNDVLSGTGTVTASAIWSRFRFISAEMWATGPASDGLPVVIDLTMVDPTNLSSVNTEQTVADSSTSPQDYAHVKIAPKPSSVASQWQNAESAGFGFKITAPVGAILDLSLEVYINNADAIQVVTAYCGTPGGAFINPNIVAGAVFMNYLDASPSGTNPGVIIPSDYQTNGANNVETARPL